MKNLLKKRRKTMSEKKWDKSLYKRKELVKGEPKEERILEVEGYALKKVHKCFFGKFYSNLEHDDVVKWLESNTLKENTENASVSVYEEIFGSESSLSEVSPDVAFSNIKDVDKQVKFCPIIGSVSKGEYFDLGNEKHFPFDDVIQKFIDEEPQREMDKINYRYRDFMGSVQGMNDTALQLLNDFEKVVKPDDVVKLPEEEQKLYETLKMLIRSVRKTKL